MEYTPDGRAWFLAYSKNPDAKTKPLYLHPVPRQEFLRLSEEEIAKCLANTSFNYEFARAIADALEEKNK